MTLRCLVVCDLRCIVVCDVTLSCRLCYRQKTTAELKATQEKYELLLKSEEYFALLQQHDCPQDKLVAEHERRELEEVSFIVKSFQQNGSCRLKFAYEFYLLSRTNLCPLRRSR